MGRVKRESDAVKMSSYDQYAQTLATEYNKHNVVPLDLMCPFVRSVIVECRARKLQSSGLGYEKVQALMNNIKRELINAGWTESGDDMIEPDPYMQCR